MYYYTSEAQEKMLTDRYEKIVSEKQDELDSIQKNSGKIQKYTAYACVSIPIRVFVVHGGNVYFEKVAEENKCPTETKIGGRVYALDSDYKTAIDVFLEGVYEYKVSFMPSGKYGPTVDYCGKRYEMPAIIERSDGQRLTVEDVEKYELGVL